MVDQPTVTRKEILEERGNRHALYICFGLIFLLALLISVLGIAAYNSRFMLMPIVPREQLPPIKPTVQKLTAALSSQPSALSFASPFRGARPLRGGSVTTSAGGGTLAAACGATESARCRFVLSAQHEGSSSLPA